MPKQGNAAQWATAGKQAVGTAVNLNSKVWFTLANGVMTEVYYPDVTVANVHLLQFVVVNSKTKKVETEFEDAKHNIENLSLFSSKYISPLPFLNNINRNVSSDSSLIFNQSNRSKTGSWNISKTYVTDPQKNTLLISVRFDSRDKDNELYIYYDPSLANSGMGDTGWTDGRYLLASDGQISSALTCGRCKFSDATSGFLGVNDGLTQLKENGKIVQSLARVEKGNVVQVAKITPILTGLRPSNNNNVAVIDQNGKLKKNSADDHSSNMVFALGFGSTPKDAMTNAYESLTKDFDQNVREYQEEWAGYIKKLPKVEPKYQAQFNMAAMILKAFEDKTNRGANIASLSKPWGGALNANDVGSSGYHAVWARDLYQVATAFMALGDRDAANRALDFLFKIQQKPDGSFPQNSWIDGKPIGGSLQMDQVGFPLILAHELGRFDRETYQKHIKPAADFIVKNGPITPQERWEEKGGYSPSTIAAEIAGLVCAAEIAKKNGDADSANRWLKTADEWADNVEKWTVTTTGKHSKEPYYVRLTQNGKPDAGEKYEINGVYGMVDERDIVDAGFLELVRLGIKSPDDKIVQNSIKVVDQVIKVNTPNGEGFYRYNFDSYGEPDNGQRWNFDGKWTGKGRLWALLSGERGQFEIALNREMTKIAMMQSGRRVSAKTGKAAENPQSQIPNPKSRLDAMQNFANGGLMIPEQVWDSPIIPKNVDRQFMPELKFGEGTGSATPLAWSMAQFIRLTVNLQEGRNLDTPKVVYDRYVLGKKDISNLQETGVERFLINKASFLSGDPTNETKSPEIYKTKPKSETETVMHFVYLGKEKSVQIVGDFCDWKPNDRLKFHFNGNYSNLFLRFPNSARVEYKLIVDGKWITDPLNPNKIGNGIGGENSFFKMPDYKPTIWDDKKGESPNAHDVQRINSKIYGEREVEVYVPEGFEKQPLPVMYLQDGNNYQTYGKAITIQRNLVKANKLKPFIMVFLNPTDRMKEYWANDDYAKFLEEVVPMIDSKYNTIKSRDGRAVMGASLGGITAVHVGLNYPQIFGRIGGQSTSFWIDNERVVKDLEKFGEKETLPLKFYFDDGTLEGVEDSRKVVEILKGKGLDVTYIETEAGHNWTAWRDRLADAFIAIWK